MHTHTAKVVRKRKFALQSLSLPFFRIFFFFGLAKSKGKKLQFEGEMTWTQVACCDLGTTGLDYKLTYPANAHTTFTNTRRYEGGGGVFGQGSNYRPYVCGNERRSEQDTLETGG